MATNYSQYGITSAYASAIRAPDGTELKPTVPTPSPSGANNPTLKPQPGGGAFSVDAGLTPNQAAAQERSDVLTQRNADLGYTTAEGLPAYVEWSYGGPSAQLGIVQSLARRGLYPAERATKKTYTQYTALDALKKMPQDQADALRDTLYKAGFYDSPYYSGKSPKTPAKGTKIGQDFDTIGAFTKAFEYAANTQQSLDDVFAGNMGLLALAQNQKEQARERTPLVVQLTSDEELSNVFRKAAMDTIGRMPTPAEVGRYIAAYHGTEAGAQRQQYAMTGSGLPGGTGGTITAPATPSAAAEEQLRTQHPVEYGVQRGEKGLQVLTDLFTKAQV